MSIPRASGCGPLPPGTPRNPSGSQTPTPSTDQPQVTSGPGWSVIDLFKPLSSAMRLVQEHPLLATLAMQLYGGVRHAGASAPTGPLTLVHTVSQAYALGVNSTLIGWTHGYLQPMEYNLIADTIQGAGLKDGKDGGRPVLLILPSVDGREPPTQTAAQLLDEPPFLREEGEHARRMVDVMSHQPGLGGKLVNPTWQSPNFALSGGSPDCSVVTASSILFALGRQTGPDTLAYPWMPDEPSESRLINEVPTDRFARMMRHAPTLFVTDGAIFDSGLRHMMKTASIGPVMRHYLKAGLIVAIAQVNDSHAAARSLVLLPPLPGMVDAFAPYAGRDVHGTTVHLPTPEAQARYWHERADSSRIHGTDPWLQVVESLTAMALLVGGHAMRRLTASASSAKEPSFPPRLQQTAVCSPQQPRRSGRTRHGTKESGIPTEPKGGTSPSQKARARQQITPRRQEPGKVFDEALAELRDQGTSARLQAAAALGAHAAAELAQGYAPQASARLRALLHSEPDPENAYRLLQAFGVCFGDVLDELAYLVEADPDDYEKATELAALRKHQAFAELADPRTEDHVGDEKGRRGPEQRLPSPTPPKSAGPLPVYANDKVAQPMPLSEVFGHVRSRLDSKTLNGFAEFKNGAWHLFVPGVKYPHLHLTEEFATVSRSESQHAFLYAQGGVYRPAAMPAAQTALRDDDSHEVLRLIEGRSTP